MGAVRPPDMARTGPGGRERVGIRLGGRGRVGMHPEGTVLDRQARTQEGRRRSGCT